MKDQFRTPLRSVLRNFLNHIEKLESSSCPESSYEAEFQNLKLFSETVKSQKEYACTEGEKETNRKKNRYKDILPFDISRVILNEYVGIPGSDYINANYIKGASGSPAYIACQGPLPCTVNDFWRMVVQCEVQVIVMACNEEEAGKAKCEKYWVDEGEEKQFGMISVKLLKSSTVCPDFSVRTMRLKYTNNQNVVEERTVCQLHYVAWPDHGVPTVVQPLLEMVRLVRDTQASETLPVLVHCSAGCGRTGTICAIDYVWGLLRTGKLTEDFSLLGLIREMRRQRISMVQTKEQYILVHQAVRELFKEQLLMIDSHPYENVDPEGLLIIKDEENHYDTVETISNTNYDEKKDSTMEKDVAPPLPQKKHNVYSSKQEKDVVNLSAQQRSINLSAKKQHGSKTAASIPKTPSSDENVPTAQILRKKIPNPIPSKGILRVPHLKNMSTTPVKRSKSLKLMNSGFKQNMSGSPEVPMETKRRGSLESNMGEAASITGDDTSSITPVDDLSSSRDRRMFESANNTTNPMRKYSMLNYLEEKRPLVRSLTTFDMRQKHIASNAPPNDKSTVPHSANKCKLARSNTQVDFSRLLTGRTPNPRHGPNIELGLKSPVSPLRKNNAHDLTPLSIFISQRNESKPTYSERPLRPNFSDKHNEPQGIYQPPNACEDLKLSQYGIVQKDDFQWNPLLRREAPFMDASPSKDRKATSGDAHVRKTLHTDRAQEPCSSNSRNYQTNVPVYRYPKKYGCFPTDDKGPRLVDTYSSPLRRQCINGPLFKEPVHIKHGPATQQIHPPVMNSRVNKYPYLSESPIVSPLRVEPRGSKHSGRFDIRNPLPIRELPAKEYRSVLQPMKNDGSIPLLHTDHQGILASSSKSNTAHIPFSEKDVTRNPFELSNSKSIVKSGNVSYTDVEENKGGKQSVDKVLHDVPIQSKASNSPTSRAWRPNSSPNYQFNPQEANKPDDDLEDVRRSFHGESSAVPGAGFSQAQVLMRKDPNSKESDYFSNAPGVDIDQVAASIPQKDMSKSKLMKVALEAFNIRRSRQQARLPDSSSSSSKGSSASSSSAGGKKKQQQYL